MAKNADVHPALLLEIFMISLSLGLDSVPAKGLHPLTPSGRETWKSAFELDRLLRDILEGPLRGQRTTILMPKELDDEVIGGSDLVKRFKSPITLLRFSNSSIVDDGDKNLLKNMARDVQETSGMRNGNHVHPIPLQSANYIDEDGGVIHIKKDDNVVLVTPDEETYLRVIFSYPPTDWAVRAILVISLSPSCWLRHSLESPLVQITPWAVVICPSVPQGPSGVKMSKFSFKVWTWKPFAEDKLVDLGTWNPEGFRGWKDLFIDRFRDMSTKTINILANAIDRPFFYTRENGESAGQTFRIVEAIGGWLKYGINISSGASVSYSTMQDMVKIGENDLMFNYATPTLERNENYQLTVPYAYEGFGLMLERPPPLPQWQNVLYPFSWQVWVATLVSFLVVSVTFHSLYHRQEKSFLTNAITVSQSLLSNPLSVVPEGWRVRYFLLAWWICCWVITLSYTCNLIAILTVPVFPAKIQTTYQLADSNYRLCMVDYGEFVPEALRTSTQPTLFSLGAKLDMVPQVDHLPEMGEEACVELVLAGSHCHTEAYPYAATLYSMWDLDPKVYALKERLYPSYLVMLIYKYAPWKHKFDIGMARLREAGLLKKWYDDAMDEFKGAAADDGSTTELKPLSLSHLQGPFYLLGCGLFVGFLLLGGEVFIPPAK